jgi:hypothetical protein
MPVEIQWSLTVSWGTQHAGAAMDEGKQANHDRVCRDHQATFLKEDYDV